MAVQKVKTFSQPISSLTYALLFIVSITWCLVIFQPSLWEILVILATEQLSLLVMLFIDKKCFCKLYPKFSLVFPKENLDEIGKLDKNRQIAFLNSLLLFPLQRSKYIIGASFFKVLPNCLLIVFWWDHKTTNFEQFLLFILDVAIVLVFTYAAVFIEIHNFVSKKIAEYHQKFDWREAFSSLTYPSNKLDFSLHEIASMTGIAVLVCVLQIILVAFDFSDNKLALALKILAVGLLGILLFGRLWFLGRRHFEGGLSRLFKHFEAFDHDSKRSVIALHSSPMLAKFETTFNQLTERLRSTEKEISAWMVHETNQSRYRALGEISGLVAHDLMMPLHIVDFCVSEISVNPALASDKQYIEELTTNTQRAVELVKSLRSYLRAPSSSVKSSRFIEAHEHVLKLLKTQFFQLGFSNVKISTDDAVSQICFSINTPDLVHILYNLYKNSVENLLRNNISDPIITIKSIEKLEDYATLTISDNGTGLSLKMYERMTAFRLTSLDTGDFQEGLGLRLTRRLIERNNGTLNLTNPLNDRGTAFALRLPVTTV